MINKDELDTVNNKLCYLFKKYPGLVDHSNDVVIDAYKKEFIDGVASETITRTWRKLKEEGLYVGTNNEAKTEAEKVFKEYFGKK